MMHALYSVAVDVGWHLMLRVPGIQMHSVSWGSVELLTCEARCEMLQLLLYKQALKTMNQCHTSS